jgi:hypothetical protein
MFKYIVGIAVASTQQTRYFGDTRPGLSKREMTAIAFSARHCEYPINCVYQKGK